MRKALLLVCGATAVAGCFYPGDRGRQLEQRVDQLTEEEKKLDGQMAETKQRSDAKIAEMNKALGDLDTAEHRTGADIGVQLQKVAEEVAQLRGQVESYLYKMNEMDASLKKMSDDVDAKLTAIKGTDAVKEAEAKKKADELKRPADKKEFFSLAEDKAKGGDSALARELYNEFLKKWPKDDLVGDAHYGVGESYFVEEKCREALSEYGKVIQDFPKSRSAPSAYLRSAECFKKLKMAKESKLALEELVRSYPKSDAAKAAKQRLVEPEKTEKKKGTK